MQKRILILLIDFSQPENLHYKGINAKTPPCTLALNNAFWHYSNTAIPSRCSFLTTVD